VVSGRLCHGRDEVHPSFATFAPWRSTIPSGAGSEVWRTRACWWLFCWLRPTYERSRASWPKRRPKPAARSVASPRGWWVPDTTLLTCQRLDSPAMTSHAIDQDFPPS
jgi:hypothetical protein